jgi:hypothetical protein
MAERRRWRLSWHRVREYGWKQNSSMKIVLFFTKCDVSLSAMHPTSFDQPDVSGQGTPMSFQWTAEMISYLLVICVLSCFLNQFLIFCSIQRDVVRAYIFADMGLSMWPVITACFPFSRCLFSFRPNYVSVHVGFMYHKHFFLLTIQRCLSRFGTCGIHQYNLFPVSNFLFSYLFSFWAASSDIFISIWNMTIYRNHVWSMQSPQCGKQTLMELLVRWPDSRNRICVFFDFSLLFSSAGGLRLFSLAYH